VAARSALRSPALKVATRALAYETAACGPASFARVSEHGDPDSANRLVHGDNLDAMRWLAQRGFAGKVRCAYLDPPFNTGRTFAEYDDAATHGEWIATMRPRLEALRALLSHDGALFAEIDDTMLGPLLVLLDEVMGADNRVSTITVVRSASTGHKAINAGPVNVADYVLVYARERARWRPNPLVKPRGSYDAAYSTFVANVDAPCEAWVYTPLKAHAARVLGYGSAREARVTLGARFDATCATFAIDHARNVVRFAQPRLDAVSREARAWIARSKREPDATLRLARPGFKDMILHGGNRVLSLADKVRGGAIVEPLTNVWSDVPFQGIAREGGVVFPRNKKPERLVERVLEMSTDEGDWVLDPFLGSGTTCAVAHKMRRRWIGIERGDQLDTMCVPRLARVVDGVDAGGVTRAQAWTGGGGFGVWR